MATSLASGRELSVLTTRAKGEVDMPWQANWV
jgi:hypothetical protein